MGDRTRRIASGAAALALAALVATLPAACGSGSDDEPSPSSSPRTIEVKPAAKQASVTAAVGDHIVVSLDANATTGYSWEFTPGDTFTIDGSKYVPDPNPSGLAGSGGTQRVTLTVTKAGESELIGVYRRSWETPTPGAKPDFTLTVESTE